MLKSKKHKNYKKARYQITGIEAIKRLIISALVIAAILIPYSSYKTVDQYDKQTRKAYWDGLMRIGDVYMSRGMFMESTIYYDAAIKFANETGNKERKAMSLNKNGRAYYVYGNYNKALELFNKALSEYNDNDLDNNSLKSSIYKNIGNAYEHSEAKESIEEIKDVYNEALKAANKSNPKNYNVIIDILTNSAIRDYKESIPYMEEYLKIAEKDDNQTLEVRLLAELSISFSHLNNKNIAEEYVVKARNILNDLYDKQENCATCNVGSAFYYIGEYDKALEVLNKGLEYAINEKNMLLESSHLTFIGYCYEKIGNYKNAVEVVQRNLELHERMYIEEHHYIKFFERKLDELKSKANGK